MAAPLQTKPVKLEGPWTEGHALDFHTSSSRYLGDNEFGHPVYETVRTPLGEALYQLKYSGNRSVLPEIAESVREFLSSRTWRLDAIVPVPPSNARRAVKPVQEIAAALGHLTGLPVCGSCLTKVKTTPELKNVYGRDERERLLNGAFRIDRRLTTGKRLLLLDDLYRSGATAATLARLLLKDGEAAAVYFIAITRTRKHG